MKSTKTSYFENLEYKIITDNGSFWRTALPLFTQSVLKDEKISLADDGKTILSDEELCETYNESFSNVAHSLNIHLF